MTTRAKHISMITLVMILFISVLFIVPVKSVNAIAHSGCDPNIVPLENNNAGFFWGTASIEIFGDVEIGDEIRAYVDSVMVKSGCVGYCRVDTIGYYAMFIYGDDGTTPVKDGVVVNDIIRFTICHNGVELHCRETYKWTGFEIQDVIGLNLTGICEPKPVADFTADQTNGSVPLQVIFTNNSSFAAEYAWNFGDGNTSTGASPTHTYTQPGTYTVTLTAKNFCGESTQTKVDYIIGSNYPAASFTADPNSGCAPLRITFINTSINADDYAWNFGDGNTSTEISPTHTYNQIGVYSVSLEASNAYGTSTKTMDGYIVIGNYPGAAFIADPNTGCVPLEVFFNNHSANADNYEWNFGDGSASTEASPTHTYMQSGTYTVSLKAFNILCDGFSEATETIAVVDTPIAEFIAQTTSGCAPFQVIFINNSTNADTYEWDFGDGSASTEAAPTHSYSQTGTYTVTLKAYNTLCTGFAETTKQDYIIVSDKPMAGFSVDKTTGCSPLALLFTNASVNADRYEWDFGDNSTSTEVSPSHTYTQAGIYTVTLHALNNCGESTEKKEALITINNPPAADFTTDSTTGCMPLKIDFMNNSANADRYEWDFGDGSNSTEFSPSHIYAQGGLYTVILKAFNTLCDGYSEMKKEDYIQVDEQANAAFTADPNTGCAPLQISFTNNSTNADRYEWDFGDGAASSEAAPTHVYMQKGHYTVQLKAYNTACEGFSEIIKEALITVFESPHAEFSIDLQSGCAPMTVHCANQSSEAAGYLWDFGDGNTSTALNPTYSYITPGNYNITLDIENVCGTDRKVMPVEVKESNIVITTSQASGCTPLTVDFGLTISCITEHTAYWEFGDGNSYQGENPTYTYTQSGKFIVAVQVTDSITGQVIEKNTAISVMPFCTVKTDKWIFAHGMVEVNHADLPIGNWIGAFVKDVEVNGGCIGSYWLSVPGSYGAMAIYGDDPTTTEKDGAVEGDSIIFKTIDPNTEVFTELCAVGPDRPIWSLAKEVLNINLTDSVKQEIPLCEGWNLISFQINRCIYEGAQPSVFIPEGIIQKEIPSLKGWLLDPDTSPIRDASNQDIVGDWQRITSFDANGAYVLDKDLPEFTNTLTYLSAGYGYWIKMNNPGVLIVEGQYIAGDTSLTLQGGWNLIGYIPYDVSFGKVNKECVCPYDTGSYMQEENIAYCKSNSFISILFGSNTGEYRRIIGFDCCKGAMIYDTNIHDFYNTLQYIGPKYGYWIKIENPEGGDLVFPQNCQN